MPWLACRSRSGGLADAQLEGLSRESAASKSTKPRRACYGRAPLRLRTVLFGDKPGKNMSQPAMDESLESLVASLADECVTVSRRERPNPDSSPVDTEHARSSVRSSRAFERLSPPPMPGRGHDGEFKGAGDYRLIRRRPRRHGRGLRGRAGFKRP